MGLQAACCRGRATNSRSKAPQSHAKTPSADQSDQNQAIHAVVSAGIVDLAHAAELLQVSPETLLGWEQTFGYPQPVGTEHTYRLQDLLALKAALASTHSLAAAIRAAQSSSTNVGVRH